MPTATWGVCATVNEPDYVLENFVNHYLNLGASQICLFFDTKDDGFIRKLQLRRSVICIPQDHGLPIKLADGASHELKQQANYRYFVTHLSHTDWTGHVDADELVRCHLSNLSLGDYFGSMDIAVSAVRMLPVEAVYSERDNIDVPFSASIFRRPALPHHRYTGCMNAVYGKQVALLNGGGLAGHIKGKTFIRRNRTFKLIGLHMVEPVEGSIVHVERAGHFRLMHFDAVSFEHWQRKWSMRSAGTARMHGITGHRDLHLANFKEYEHQPDKLMSLFLSIYRLTADQMAKLNSEDLLVQFDGPSQSGRLPKMTDVRRKGEPGVSNWKHKRFKHLTNVEQNLNHTMNADLLHRNITSFRKAQEAIGRSSFVDVRRIVKVSEKTAGRRMLFVAGLHRSGTTLLESLITSRFKTSSLHAAVPESEGQFLQDVMPADMSFGGPGMFAFFPQMRLTPPASEEEAAQLRHRISRCWEPWCVGESELLIEKTPANIVRVPFLRSVFPGSKFLIMVRDPRAVSAATWKWNPSPMLQLFMHWCVAHSSALQSFDSDCLVVRYEDLCENVEKSMSEIESFGLLERRDVPLPLPARYKSLVNHNGKYLDRFGKLPEIIDLRMNLKPWEVFGYDLKDTFVALD